MRKTLVSLLIIAAATLLGVYLLHRPVSPNGGNSAERQVRDPDYTFVCADGKSITAVFHLPDDEGVDIALSDGRTMNLPHAMSASGARYANKDESFVFWNKGMSAFIQEGGVTTYDNCTAAL